MQLGITVIDKITGFRGVVTGFVQYITGCNQCLVVPPLGADGGVRDATWFDVQRLDVDTAVPAIMLDNGATPGCDRPAPIR